MCGQTCASGVVATLKLALSRGTLAELVASWLASMLCYVTRFRVKANKLTRLNQELDLCAHGGGHGPDSYGQFINTCVVSYLIANHALALHHAHFGPGAAESSCHFWSFR